MTKTPLSSVRKDPVTWALVLGSLGLLALYTFFIVTRSSVRPMGDDFEVALGYMNQLGSTHGLWDQFQLLFSQHNEHRLVVVRLFVLLEFAFLHHVDFPLLTYFGNLGWLAAFVFLVLLITGQGQSQRLKAFLLFLASLLLLSGRHGELMTWPVGSIQQYWQIAFMLGALWLAGRKSTWVSSSLAVIFGLGAVFSGAGGVLIFLVVAFYWLVNKQSLRALIYLAIGVATFAVYYYVLPVEAHGLASAGEGFVSWFGNAVVIGLSFVGGAAPRLKVALVLGLAMVVVAVIAFWRKPQDLRCHVLILVLLVAAATALARNQAGGFLVGISSKYSMYSLIALAALASLSLPFLVRRSRYLALGFVVFFGALYGINGIATYHNLTDRYLVTESGAFNYPWDITQARKIYEASDRNGVYPTPFLHPETYKSATRSAVAPLLGIDSVTLAGRKLTIQGWAVDPAKRSLADAVLLVVDGQGRRVLNYGYSRVDVETQLGGLERYKTCGFEDTVDLSDLPPGKHTLSVRAVAFRKNEYYPSADQEITLP